MSFFCLLFFFNDTATTEIYTLSLHDALPISTGSLCQQRGHQIDLVGASDSREEVVGSDLFLFEQRAVGSVAVHDLDALELAADLLGGGEIAFDHHDSCLLLEELSRQRFADDSAAYDANALGLALLAEQSFGEEHTFRSADQVHAVAFHQNVRATRHEEIPITDDGAHECVRRELHRRQRLVEHPRFFEIDLHELDPVLCQVDDVRRAVGPRDAAQFLRDEHARIDHHIDPEEPVADAVGPFRPCGALHPRDHVLGALFVPALQMARNPDTGGPAFLRLMGRVYSDTSPFVQGYLLGHYAPVFDRFFEAFSRALPSLPRSELGWRLHFALKALAGVLAGDDLNNLLPLFTQGKPMNDASLLARLTALVGDAGKRLHTGRSRNDQVATDIRLWLRSEIDNIVGLLKALRGALLDLAEQHEIGRASCRERV